MYNNSMRIEFDPAKDRENRKKHGISLALADQFDPQKLITRIDDRQDYGEVREIAFGLIETRVHVMVFTRRGKNRRIISLRKASKKETEIYNDAQKDL